MTTKGHFERLAKALKHEIEFASADKMPGLARAIDVIADVLEDESPRFDRARFLKACGLEDAT